MPCERFCLIGVMALMFASCSLPPHAPMIETRTPGAIPLYGLFELSLAHPDYIAKPFSRVAIEAQFTGPGGSKYRRQGFYYGGHAWMVRFRPDTAGNWTYEYVFRAENGQQRRGSGKFECLQGEAEGPIRIDPHNPYRWVTMSGTPYFPIGLQDCVSANGSQVANFGIDGEGRNEKPREVAAGEYFAIYGQAGFNMFRFSQRNCSYPLFTAVGDYREAESLATDRLLASARANGFRVMFGIFGDYDVWSEGGYFARAIKRIRTELGLLEEAINRPADRWRIEQEKRFVDYCVARWGVYVDFWELLNERKASDDWTRIMASYLRSVDPDHKPVSTSYEKPQLVEIDINAPHWYESEPASDSDLRVHLNAAKWKSFGKPVIVGEQGNTGMNWDPGSAERMRIRTWTSLFEEIGLVFWNTSWSKAGMHHGHYTPGAVANIYLGPQERSYVAILRRFCSALDRDIRQARLSTSDPGSVRTYALASNSVFAAYLHRYAVDRNVGVQLRASIELPWGGKSCAPLDLGSMRRSQTGMCTAREAQWIDPVTGRIVAQTILKSRTNSLDVPPFEVDLALLVRAAQ
jgi:Domain of unknown function (DUF5060)